MDTSNVVLIGMPGSGKSTVGVLLAKVLGYDFIDTDLLIQRREGRTLPEILSAEGHDRFLEIESEVCKALNVHSTVIATGGSAVYGSAAMAHLKKRGRVVFLEVPFEALAARLSDIRGRGVVLKPGQSLLDLYSEREPLYRRWADLTVGESSQTLEETVAAVLSALGQ